MSKDKFYYYDKKNDLLEYNEGKEGTFAQWVNPYLTLMFPHGCKELTAKNAVGFQIEGLRHMLDKAEEQASVPLTPEQEKEIDDMLLGIGFKHSVETNGDKDM